MLRYYNYNPTLLVTGPVLPGLLVLGRYRTEQRRAAEVAEERFRIFSFEPFVMQKKIDQCSFNISMSEKLQQNIQ